MTTNSRVWQVSFAMAMILLACVVWWDVSRIEVVSLYDSAGPRLFPMLFSGGLALCAVVVIVQAFSQELTQLDAVDLAPVALVSAGLLVQILLVERIGWIPAATLQFVLVARAFGRFSIAKTFVFGFILAAVTYVGFTHGLGLDLPSVPFAERIFG